MESLEKEDGKNTSHKNIAATRNLNYLEISLELCHIAVTVGRDAFG